MGDSDSSRFFARIEPCSRRDYKLYAVTAALVCLFAVLDIWTKNTVVATIPYGQIQPVLDGFFDLCHVRNYGAAFGQFQSLGTPLLVLSLTVFVAIIIFFRQLTEGCAERYIAFALILAGIAGNCSDRIFREPAAVVDFLSFYVNWGGTAHYWPAFNVADSCICVGGVIFALSTLWRSNKHEKKA